MASTSSQNKKSRSTHSDCEMMDQDKISDVPGCVLDEILSRLSIKDMVRTSVLSTKWRFKWASVPSLVVDARYQEIDRIDRVINHILLLHMGPVHKFKLTYNKTIPSDEVYKWIIYLSRHSIKEIVLELRDNVSNGYRIPSSLFCCQGLTRLDLGGFSLSLPSVFNGFKNLKSLTLDRVEIAQQDVEELISRSPVLERLTLSDVYSVDQLNIHGPNLLFFYIDGHFVDVCFKSASRLTELHIDAEAWNDAFEIGDSNEFGDLRKLMADIPQISRLWFVGRLREYLAGGDIPRKLPIPCTNLTFLYIDVDFSRLKEVSILLCLLRSAPNLVELRIESEYELGWFGESITETSSEWVQHIDGLDHPLTRLRVVKIQNFMGKEDEMNFVKSVLLASPSLECMTIQLDHNVEVERTMLSFKRASPKAEIRVCEYF